MTARGDLVGVRLDRGGHVRWVEAAGYEVIPGQLVLVADAEGEMLATVAVGSGQIVENEPDVASDGRIVRLASAAEVRELDRWALEQSLSAGIAVPHGWGEWLAAPDAEPFVQDATAEADTISAADFLAQRFPVAKREVRRFGRRREGDG